MKALGYAKSPPIENEDSLEDIEAPDPQPSDPQPSDPGPHDLLVEVAAVPVYPVDARIRAARPHR